MINIAFVLVLVLYCFQKASIVHTYSNRLVHPTLLYICRSGDVLPHLSSLLLLTTISLNMRVILLVTLLIGWVTSQDVEDPEPECWKVLYPSSTSWFLKEYYDESFGIVHNVTALQTLDVRQTNVFLEIQPWQWSEGFLQNYIYRLLDKAFGPYLKDVVVDGSQRVWNEDEMDYNIPQIEADRSGSLEEMLRFQAKYLEDEFTMSEVNRSLNKLANAKFNKKSNKDIETSLNDNLQKLMNPDQPWGVAGWWYRAVAYNDWTSKMEDRLIKHLKNKAFF